MQVKTQAPRPWYKEPWPWILVGIPLMSVIVGSWYAYLAVTTKDTLVSDDYYNQGKAINLQLDRDRVSAQMQLLGQAVFSDDMRAVRLMIKSKEPLAPQLTLRLLHPTLADHDQTIALNMVSPGLYQGSLTPSKAEHWYVRLEDPKGKWRIQGEWLPADGPQVTLDPMLPDGGATE
ncbi:FixH family protein [Crenobacter sp. SG2303]|uniref:FixH family protein n=1 Tax=Crenobacter oryzisoli TaxID=3056844 RepID=A0ABT7XJG9_9NEIS|nr:FixH family protein [Crenobacter sp. SG2303]MDN0073939.1 FixH family protein [Crenobacter sp. SG2303]